ncbi:c-type cytochrome [Flavobacterium sp. H122]|uniref:c-type cytochrome n=1 Tax=Flavobacterium sp. H122 TaxID=2529860 RepID=UPI0020C04FB8|nr:c-type cytochrome [Flavobacterium sp. H122]
MLKSKIFMGIAVSAVLFSCSKKAAAPKVTDEVKMAEEAKELPVEIAEGKTLYENNCAKCHKLFPAGKHDKEGWSKTLEKMAPKAKITDDQKVLVYNYLTYGM